MVLCEKVVKFNLFYIIAFCTHEVPPPQVWLHGVPAPICRHSDIKNYFNPLKLGPYFDNCFTQKCPQIFLKFFIVRDDSAWPIFWIGGQRSNI